MALYLQNLCSISGCRQYMHDPGNVDETPDDKKDPAGQLVSSTDSNF